MSTTLGVFEPDNLIAGTYPIRTAPIVLKSGQNIVRGTVLGIISATKKHVISLSAAGDGSEIPDMVASDDIDASAVDVKGVAYIKGEFNQNAMTFGTGHTAESTFTVLKDKGIILRDSVQTS